MPRSPSEIPDAVLRVLLTPHIGPRRFAAFIERFKSFESLSKASADTLAQVRGISSAVANEIARGFAEAPIDEERERMAAADVSMVIHGDEDYPALLASIPDPPIALWIRGEARPEDAASIAIVGSRRCTAYGRDQTMRFSSLLAESGLTIVSGGARGIDGEAHRAALRVNGRTIVVCGCGLGHTYPPEHKDLFDRVADGFGAVVSEYSMNVAPRAQFFPRRNRIISGLSLGVLVIEAGRGSGALITARQASDDHNREVMAIPGAIDSPASRGCLEAIRDGWAGMVLDHADVITQLDSSRHLIHGAFATFAGQGANGCSDDRTDESLFELQLTEEQRDIVACLDERGHALHPDELSVHLQRPVPDLLADLTLLQIRGVITRRDGRIHLRSRGWNSP